MQQYQYNFIKFILENNALKFGEFKLKSGRLSPYFFNAGAFNTGKKIAQLGAFYAAAIQAENMDYDVLFGPAYKGIPLVTSVAIALAQQFNQDKPYCFNRKEMKDHGEGGHIVGAALTGRVLVVDDVITAGTAVNESAKLIFAAQATLAGLIIILDRQERGQSALSAIQEVSNKYQTQVISIIKLENIIEFLSEQSGFQKELSAIKQYRAQYGI